MTWVGRYVCGSALPPCAAGRRGDWYVTHTAVYIAILPSHPTGQHGGRHVTWVGRDVCGSALLPAMQGSMAASTWPARLFLYNARQATRGEWRGR